MSNFVFLQGEWAGLYREAQEAERLTFVSPKACAIICRSALEKAVRWMYDNDGELIEPYQNTLAALMHEPVFKEILNRSIYQEIHLVRQMGNNAAHGRSVKPSDALVSLKNLFRFLSYMALLYSEEKPLIPPFDEALIPKGEAKKESLKAMKALEAELELSTKQAIEERKKLENLADENTLLKQRLEEQEKSLKARKHEREQTVNLEQEAPRLISEQQTRKLYIDQLLKEAGWDDLREGYELEYEVRGMPAITNPSGKGYVDYVLWATNGKPLALIEAKKTMANASQGKHQATLYADCLEHMHGQRPLIFYSNGFETYLWDDTFYPARKVQGFYTRDELQLLIDRRHTRQDLRNFKVNEAIAGRYYQKEAIQRVAENFVSAQADGPLRAKRRKALLVMATGSGKTRTAAAIVDMLTKCNWAKRVLFLADRNVLVTQAKNAFNEHLPHLSAIDLTKEKEDSSTRLVFSTYPTILNKIDSARNQNERFYGPGHFDLVIIDEAHRSVYKKYGAIFEYFDSLLIGLTATPKKEVDRNTYALFDIEDDNPTYAYELDQAVGDGFLVPPKAISVPLKFQREGIKYHDLSDKEREEYEEKFGDPGSEEAPDAIGSSALNSWLFNSDTVDKVLAHLMEHGIKVQGGDKLGKTIIFAKNHNHAEYIEERFNKNYPEHAGGFLRIIDNQTAKAADMINKFSDPKIEYLPQIAVSVDMMDTGVDAHRVVNLVFFKLVRSYTKFWQMIGRGTRLCPNLFAPDEDKQFFMVFDYCQNFEFFDENPEGISGSNAASLTQRIFDLKLDIVFATREKIEITEQERALETHYAEQLFELTRALNRDRFMVRMALKHVEEFSRPSTWAHLTHGKVQQLRQHIAPLILPQPDDHELARRFDIVMLNICLARLTAKDGSGHITRVMNVAAQLSKVNVPDVNTQAELLKELQTESFWKKASVKRLEEVRQAVRELMKYLESQSRTPVYTHFEDDLDLSTAREVDVTNWSTGNLKPYQERVTTYIRQNANNVLIQKLRNNIPITPAELQELEAMLFNEELGSKDEYIQQYGEQPLGTFIRSIVGLDIKAANQAFSEFLQRGNLRADQISFLHSIIQYLEKNGSIQKRLLFEPPFTNLNDQGLLGIFDDADAHKVISILNRINGNAEIS